jgi:hypothetical protein
MRRPLLLALHLRVLHAAVRQAQFLLLEVRAGIPVYASLVLLRVQVRVSFHL